jgi:uncharacterized RDD family membrane protein YckC
MHEIKEVLTGVMALFCLLIPLALFVVFKHFQYKKLREQGFNLEAYEEKDRIDQVNKSKAPYEKYFGKKEDNVDPYAKLNDLLSKNAIRIQEIKLLAKNKGAWVPEYLKDEYTKVTIKRLLAFYIDLIISFLILMVAELILGSQSYQNTVAIWIVLALAYLSVFEGIAGFSLGKKLCRIKVVDAYGNGPGLKEGVIRGITRLIEFNPIVLFIPAIVSVLKSKTDQRIGDHIAHTYVISSDDLDI